MTTGATSRVIALVDMDCFYCQVETRLNSDLRGKPVAVVQYNQWQGGGIIAVNYEAKAKGVTRGMRGAQAKEICPEINLVSVPVLRGKSDLSKYREAGDEVAEVFSEFSDLIQRASIDEAYIDLTKAVDDRIKNGISNINADQLKSTYVVGFSDLKNNNEENRCVGLRKWINLINDSTSDSPDFQLSVGALIVEEMRHQIFLKTNFHCSAGIAHNKILAKQVAGLHKPNHQTILPQDGVPELYHSLPLYKMRNLGGKFGRHVEKKLSIKYMSDLHKYSLRDLQQKFDEKSGIWLFNIARGIDLEPVTPRLIPESIGCCKNFPGKNMLRTKRDVEHWVSELADEISERLSQDMEKNKRRARLLTVSLYQNAPVSRSDNLSSYETKGISNIALELLKKFNTAPSESDSWDPPIKYLGLSVSKFANKESEDISRFLKNNSNCDGNPETQFASKITTKMKDDVMNNVEPKAEANTIKKYFKSVNTNGGNNCENSSFFLSFLSNHSSSSSESRTVASSPGEEMTALKRTRQEATELDCESLAQFAAGSLSTENVNGTSDAGYSSDGGFNLVDTCVNDKDIFSETKVCEECGETVNVDLFLEHMDYHVAVKLQAEINKEMNSSSNQFVNLNQRRNIDMFKNKRKILTKVKPEAKKIKSIKSFFQVLNK